MPNAPDKIPDNIEFATNELLQAPGDQRPAMLEDIAKALTRRLLQGPSWSWYPGGFGARYRIHQGSSGSPRIIQWSGVLVHEGHEPLRLGGGEVDVVGDPFLASDADREPAGACAESGLALGQRAQ